VAGGATTEEEESAVREEVAAQHPLQGVLGEVEVTSDGRQGDVDDRRVEQIEELDGAEQDERERPATGREERRLFVTKSLLCLFGNQHWAPPPGVELVT
jgi:hypothetical protein